MRLVYSQRDSGTRAIGAATVDPNITRLIPETGIGTSESPEFIVTEAAVREALREIPSTSWQLDFVHNLTLFHVALGNNAPLWLSEIRNDVIDEARHFRSRADQ